MPEKEEKPARLEEVLKLQTTPAIEAALAEQIRTLPQLVVEKAERGVRAAGLGLIVCCNA